LRCADGVPGALGQIRKSAFPEEVIAALGVQLQLAFQNKQDSLRRRRTENATGQKFRRHLREARSHSGRGVDDEIHAIRTGQGRANKRVRRLDQVIGLKAATSGSEMMHVTSRESGTLRRVGRFYGILSWG
jgi:hypothetical protein